MKIGFVIYGSLDTMSGGYLYDRKLIEYLRAQGDRVEIISLPWRNYAMHLTDNFWFRLPVAIANEGENPFQIRQPFDVLVQDELNHPSLIWANQGKHPYPIVSLVHHLRCSEQRPAWQNWFYRFVEKKYLQSVDGFIFNSKTTQNVVHGLIGDGKPSLVAYPPTDRFGEVMSEDEIRQRAQSQELRILFLGNVIHRKGLHTLLRSLVNLKSKVRVDVVGGLNAEPRYANRIRALIATYHLSSYVFLHGVLDREPLIEKFRHAHVLVVPSSYEGFGIAYLEGMGFGLPAIGTTAGAAREVITHGENGYLIEPDDATSLTNYLDELARNRDLLVRLSMNAVKRYRSQPKWEATAGRIRAFLSAVAKSDGFEVPDIHEGSASSSLHSSTS
ncbi:MAG TPA: glycosyltransferase family 4 protein [Anaerolineales bacterium]|nr:glycosyltransferase family 4 protein [Anaerolineales bacterium]